MLGLLASLVDKSLVLANEREGGVRYRLLEVVRQYAAGKLVEAGEAAEAGGRHARYYLALAEEAEPELKGERQEEWLGRLETEIGNTRAAMRFLLDVDDADAAVRLAWALRYFWYVRAHHEDGRRFAEAVGAKGYRLTAGQRARIAWIGGVASYGRGDAERVARLFQESADLFREAGEQAHLALALSGAGAAWLQLGETEQADAILGEALERYREEADGWGIGVTLAHLGVGARKRGERESAERYLEEALVVSRRAGFGISGHMAAYNLALLAEASGEHGRAFGLHAEGLALAASMGDGTNAAYSLEGLAQVAAVSGDPDRAARLFGASEALLGVAGGPRYFHAQDQASRERAVEGLRLRLGAETFERAYAEGRAMLLERAVEYALRVVEEPQVAEEPGETPPELPAGLSAREAQILGLLAAGLTNARIAEELYLSPRTVNWHLTSAYRKTGSAGRAEAARFAAEHGLLL